MRQVAKAADFRSLFDHISDNVELRLTMAVASSTCSERRGRHSVIRYLQSLGGTVQPRIEELTEVFAHGERCVVCHDEGIATPGGLSLRCARTLVFDVHKGFITRIAIHYELSPAMSRRPCPSPCHRCGRRGSMITNGRK